jgi:hypothetical protein
LLDTLPSGLLSITQGVAKAIWADKVYGTWKAGAEMHIDGFETADDFKSQLGIS